MYVKLLGILSTTALLVASQPSVTFDETFGGKEDDVARSVVKVADGYIVAGKSKSFSHHRDFDAYVIKIDNSGKKLWSKVYGGDDDEDIKDIVKYGNDFIFVGSSETYGNGRLSFYMNRLDKNGDIVWQKSYYRDEDDEYFGNGVATDGKSIVIAGTERHLNFMASKINPFIFELDENGTMGWKGYYGGKDEDYANAIAFDGDGYVFAGKTESIGQGDFDAYLVKLNKKGERVWHNAYGGKDDDVAYDVEILKDGYLIVGSTDSFDLSRDDAYVAKIDKSGKLLWQNTYGGNRDDQGYAVTKSPDGGFVVVGRSESFARSRRNGFDLYLFKIDSNGKLKWEHTYGGESDDAGYDIVSTKDGYLIVGDKKSRLSRDSNVWILKVDLNGEKR